MLGDTDAKQLGDATVAGASRKHVLAEEYRRAVFFKDNPWADPTAGNLFPDVKWMRLSGSGLWISYGEMTSLADWLPPNFDTLSSDVVTPGLQRMRQDTCAKILDLAKKDLLGFGVNEFPGDTTEEPSFQWAATISGVKGFALSEAGVESDKAVDESTAPLGPDRYLSLVARNACHFAPFSWHRWAELHTEAQAFALTYHRSTNEARPLKDVNTLADENLRQAWLHTGYGEHFLQDSFAAGHLINKTLVMQWFVDYVNGLSSAWWDVLGPFVTSALDLKTKPWYGLPPDEVMENMGTSEQTELAGRHLYGSPSGEATSSEDWAGGFAPTDPQTAYERRTREQRIAGSGVQASSGHTKEFNYAAYLQFLNSSFLSLAAGETHDYFNHRGLFVRNEQGDIMKVGGDNTLLEKSGQLGAERAAEATSLSRKAIDDILRDGATDITVDKIWRLVPTSVFAAPWEDLVSGDRSRARFYGLEEWHDEVLHDICVHEIFPGVVESVSSKAVRAFGRELSDDFSERLGTAQSPTVPGPPIPDNIGDFIVPDMAGSTAV